MYSIFCQRRRPREKSEPVCEQPDREVSPVAGALRLKLLRELLFTLVTQLMVRVEFVNAMQSLRVFVVPKNRKRREIALEREMSRERDFWLVSGLSVDDGENARWRPVAQ
jgi:hypothetical protein